MSKKKFGMKMKNVWLRRTRRQSMFQKESTDSERLRGCRHFQAASPHSVSASGGGAGRLSEDEKIGETSHFCQDGQQDVQLPSVTEWLTGSDWVGRLGRETPRLSETCDQAAKGGNHSRRTDNLTMSCSSWTNLVKHKRAVSENFPSSDSSHASSCSSCVAFCSHFNWQLHFQCVFIRHSVGLLCRIWFH